MVLLVTRCVIQKVVPGLKGLDVKSVANLWRNGVFHKNIYRDFPLRCAMDIKKRKTIFWRLCGVSYSNSLWVNIGQKRAFERIKSIVQMVPGEGKDGKFLDLSEVGTNEEWDLDVNTSLAHLVLEKLSPRASSTVLRKLT